MYSCRVERDSITPHEDRLTTFVICFPRLVLAEVVTHRLNRDSWGDFECSWCERTATGDISKNSASSRAISFKRMLETVKDDPFMPLWTREQKGMQGESTFTDEDIQLLNSIWLNTLEINAVSAQLLNEKGVHKQDCNRLLEPWAWVTQIVTSSQWDNFFALRCHQAAHPAFRHMARLMFLHRRRSRPQFLQAGQWHLPFVPLPEQEQFFWHPRILVKDDMALENSNNSGHILEGEIPDLIKFSAARCAWVSYQNHDKDGSPEKMLGTWNTLVGNTPRHASPMEHQATPLTHHHAPSLRSNLAGWLQARKLLTEEYTAHYNPSETEIASWNMTLPEPATKETT